MTTPEDLAKAREIVNKYIGGEMTDWLKQMTEAFAAALAEARSTPKPAAEVVDALEVPEGYVRTSDGVVRKLIGTLPLTLDGCLVGDNAEVWINYFGGPPAKFTIQMGSHSTPWEGSQSYHHAYGSIESAQMSFDKHKEVSDGKGNG